MLAPLARRIALARPVATAFQTRPFSATSPNNDNNQGTVSKLDNTPAKELSDFKRFTPADIFSEFTDAAGRAELNKIRDTEDELIQTVSAEVEPIDWEQWRKEIQYPGLVDELKQIHDDTPMPDVEEEKRKLEQQVEDTFNPILDELHQMAAEAEAKAEEYEKKAEEISYIHDNLKEMTVDEFLERYPSVKEAIAKDVEENRWFVEE